MDEGRTRRHTQRFAELGLAAGPVAFEAEGVVREQGTCLAVPRIQFEGAQSRFAHLVEVGKVRREDVRAEHRADGAERRIRLCEARVEADGLLEQHDCLPISVDRALLRQVARAIEEVTGLGALRRQRERQRFTGLHLARRRSECRGDRREDRIGFLEAMRPELQPVLRTRETGDAADARAAALDAAFDDVVDPEQLADGLQRQVALAGLERGDARHHLEARHAPERVDQLVGEADREGRVVRMAGHVAERKNSDRASRRRSCRSRRSGVELRHVAADRDRHLEDLVATFIGVEAQELLAQAHGFDPHERFVGACGHDDMSQEVPMALRSAKGRAGQDPFESGLDQYRRIGRGDACAARCASIGILPRRRRISVGRKQTGSRGAVGGHGEVKRHDNQTVRGVRRMWKSKDSL